MMERALAEYIVNAFWQIPLLAGGAWLLLHMAKPGPQAQHRVWLAVLGLCVLLPLRGMDAPGIFVARLQPAAVFIQDLSVPSVREEPLSQRRPWFESPPHFSLRTRTVRLNATAAHWLVRIYLSSVVFTLFRLTHAWSASRRLVAKARVTDRYSLALANYSRRFGVHPPQVRESEQISSPMVVGVVTPVLLLPEGSFRLTADEMSAALCHELAHIQRRDYLMNLLCQVAALPVAWHPVVNQVQQSIRTTREMVCDAMAAQEMQSHIGYARCLLALAHSMLGVTGQAEQGQFLGLFTRNTLEKRVMLLMETTKMTLQAKLARAASGAAVMIAATTVAAMFHVAPTMAQPRADAPQPPMQAALATAQAAPIAATPAASPKPVKRIHKRRVVNEQRVDQDIKREMADVKVIVDSPDFKRQMEEARRQIANVRVMLDSPEFKEQMEDVKRQTARVTATLNSPEFKRRIEEASRQLANVRIQVQGLVVEPCPGIKPPNR